MRHNENTSEKKNEIERMRIRLSSRPHKQIIVFK